MHYGTFGFIHKSLSLARFVVLQKSFELISATASRA
jgi:hypothetical protein